MRKRLIALAAVVALVGACTNGGDDASAPSSTPPPELPPGGTLRVAGYFPTPDSLDPTWYGMGQGPEPILRLLLRRLMYYPGLPTEEGGALVRPDLAAGEPEVSSDGLSWTFRLREGLTWAPPLEDVEIRADDVVRALEREADPSVNPDVPWGDYADYYSIIDGFDEMRAGEADSIRGLETPDEHTLVVRLTEPAGDLPYRFSLAATAPIPEGAADGHPQDYSRFLVASGPYMIEGSEELDPSRFPERQEPVSGYVLPGLDEEGIVTDRGSLTLVRNPSWEASSDPLRPAYPDRIEVVLLTDADTDSPAAGDRLLRRIADGELDMVLGFWAPEQVEPFREGELAGQLVVGSTYLAYLPLNMAMPPFDDVHVRRAVWLALDPVAYGMAAIPWGEVRPTAHLAPDAVEDGLLAGFRPSWMPAETPDVGAAREQMRLSAYDEDGDGRCDAAVCRSVRFVGSKWDRSLADALGEAFARVGVHVELRIVGGWRRALATAASPQAHVALFNHIAAGVDFPNGSSWFEPLFYGPSIRERGNDNTSLLGATEEQLRAWGYAVRSVPSADERIDRCLAMAGLDQVGCWAELDVYLIEDVVPAIPLGEIELTRVVSTRVQGATFDVFTGWPAFDRMALVPISE